LFFGHRISEKRMAEINEFFETMHRPVEPAREDVEQTNSRGTRGIGRMCLIYSVFILLLVLIPNSPMERVAVVFCAAFVALVGYGLIRASRTPRPTRPADAATPQSG